MLVTTQISDGVNWDEEIEVTRFEAMEGGRHLVEVAITAGGHSCTEPEGYDVKEEQLVVCEPSFCTQAIPTRRRDVTTRYLDPDWTRSRSRVTTNFALDVEMIDDGLRITRARGRVPRDFRHWLGRHAFTDLAPES